MLICANISGLNCFPLKAILEVSLLKTFEPFLGVNYFSVEPDNFFYFLLGRTEINYIFTTTPTTVILLEHLPHLAKKRKIIQID